MNLEKDLFEMRAIPEGRLADWVSRRFPKGASLQWWLSIFESLEISAHPLRELALDRRIRDLKLAAEAIPLAVNQSNVSAAIGAYWILKIAALTMRFKPPLLELPPLLTPSGSAEWALQQLPLTRERAIKESKRRKIDYLNASTGFYAPVGGEVTLPGEVAFPDLQDVELILSALQWVFSRVEDVSVKSDIRSWLEIGKTL